MLFVLGPPRLITSDRRRHLLATVNETNITSGSDSCVPRRILAGVVALPLTAFAVLVLRNQLRVGFDPIGAIFGLGAATAAVFCWWFALRGHLPESRARMRFSLLGGV